MRLALLIPVLAALLSGCERKDENLVQGYVEGEFVYVASPLEGQLEKLAVRRGQVVKKGDLLFVLESGAEKAQRDEAARKLAQAQANLEDAKRGQRPSEIDSLKAQFQQAQAALVLSDKEFERQERLVGKGVAATQDLDVARSSRDQDQKRVAKLEADLQTAQLGSRSDQIAAAAAAVQAQEASLAHADWALSQKTQYSPVDGIVFDTLYQQGEWIAAGRPAVSLLPPENVKVRAFVPEARVGSLRYGEPVKVFVDGVTEPYAGTVSFISPRAEYTPPVIYSQESRGKLVFMVESVFDPATAAKLHPGQPVDVAFGEP
ncbi:MAG TPA: HlyD family efflux transporter periplasmic adaptor subunit [Chthoniobacterales bacterium]|nr:HlyD family efflux transporter periplasmic adaptor subunit [Chthoniobacterales bacterium]